jgi:DNA-binding NtrC family response regulator
MDERTVLLVDCDQAQLNGLGEMIAAGGYTVVSCHDFDSGRRYLQTHTLGAVVTDLRLGAFNGLHLILLAKQTAPAVAAIVYSGREDSGMRQEAVLGGATYLEKETLRSSLLPHLHARIAIESENVRPAGSACGAERPAV